MTYFTREFTSTKEIKKEISMYIKYGYSVEHRFDGIMAIVTNEDEQVTLIYKEQ